MRIITRYGAVSPVDPAWKTIRRNYGSPDVMSTNAGDLFPHGPAFNLKKGEFEGEPREFDESYANRLFDAKSAVVAARNALNDAQTALRAIQREAWEASRPLEAKELTELVNAAAGTSSNQGEGQA